MMDTADPLPGATRFQQGAGLLDAAGALASDAQVARVRTLGGCRRRNDNPY